MARRGMLLASAVLVLQSHIVSAQIAANIRAPSAPVVSLRPGASALLAIDSNRATVIDRIVTQWAEPLAQSSAALSAQQLRTLLSGLRADHLLAASLAGNLEGLRNAISTAVTSTAVVAPSLLRTKALGDGNDDLVYTPINPCRIVDTRLGAGGFLGNDTERDWKVSRPGGNFTDQGGSSSDCTIPANPAAVLANFAVTGSSSPGVLFAWPFNQPAPTASTLNYAGGETIANAIIVPMAQGLAEDLSVFVSTGTNVVVDVVGYFKPPGAPIGTVSNIATGTGLTGGPITSTGTIALASTQLLPTTACASNQVPQWNGSAWICATVSGGGGTVTSVGTGTGLSGGPITTSGTINLASTQLLPSVACGTNQIPKWSGSVWTCATDSNSGGTVTSITAGSGLTGGTITTSGTIAVDPTSSTLTGNFFKQGGNAFGALANSTALLGTLDNNALAVLVNGYQGFSIWPASTTDYTNAVNVIGGHADNGVLTGVVGATIAGGGCHGGTGCSALRNNVVTGDFGVVVGGASNQAGNYATVGGGYLNSANAMFATVGGGGNNVVDIYGTVSGGINNSAGHFAVVPGGSENHALGWGSFAAGQQASADADGCLVWNDGSGGAITCGATPHRVVMRADGGYILFSKADNSIGVDLLPGAGAWTTHSDRALKDHLEPIDGHWVLNQLATMPIATWNWKSQNIGIRHMGPTAQDFYAAFGLGETDKGISTVDGQGVALAAIQGLNAKLESDAKKWEAKIEAQSREIAELRDRMTQMETLRGELAALKATIAELASDKTKVAHGGASQ